MNTLNANSGYLWVQARLSLSGGCAVAIATSADDDGDGEAITDDEDYVSEADDEDAFGDEDKDDVQVRPGGLPGDPRAPAAVDHPPPLHHLHPPLRTPSRVARLAH